jgi:hypothetical protein
LLHNRETELKVKFGSAAEKIKTTKFYSGLEERAKEISLKNLSKIPCKSGGNY